MLVIIRSVAELLMVMETAECIEVSETPFAEMFAIPVLAHIVHELVEVFDPSIVTFFIVIVRLDVQKIDCARVPLTRHIDRVAQSPLVILITEHIDVSPNLVFLLLHLCWLNRISKLTKR